MSKKILSIVAEQIESLSGFSLKNGKQSQFSSLSAFQSGFLRVISENQDLTRMIDSNDEVGFSSFVESLGEMESMIGPNTRANLFSKPITYEEMGEYAARIVVAKTLFKKCEIDLSYIHQSARDTGGLNKKSSAEGSADQALNKAINETSVVLNSGIKSRKIDDNTGKTVSGLRKPTATEASQILGDKAAAGISAKKDESLNTEQSQSAPGGYNQPVAKSKKSLTGEECLSLLDSTEDALKSVKTVSVGDGEASSINSGTKDFENRQSLEALRAKYSAKATEEGGNFIRSLGG